MYQTLTFRRVIFLLLCAGIAHAFFSPLSIYAGSYSRLQILLPGETAAPGTETGKTGSPFTQTVGVPFTITVRACDNSWYTDTTITNIVEIGSSDESATLPSPSALYAGEINVTVKLNAAGTYTFSAEDQSDPTIPLATSEPVLTILIQGFEFSSINQKNQYAGVPLDIEVMAVDPNGVLVSGFSGSVRLREITSYGEGRIVPDVITLINGVWSGPVTCYRADETSINRGNVNIHAGLDADPTKNGLSDPFTVHPGNFARVQIVVPGQEPLPGSYYGVSGTPATQAAGQSFDVDVYATDPYWNPLPSEDVVRITSSDPEASTPVTGSLNGGFQRFTVFLNTMGAQTLTVNDQSDPAIQGMTSEAISVIQSASDHFEIDTIPSPVTAGDEITVTIRATDIGGNLIPDYNGDAVLLANTGPGSITPEDITFANGLWIGQMTFRGAGGAVTFSCSDFSAPPHTGTSNSFEVLPGAYEKLQALLPPQIPKGGTEIGYEGIPTDQNAGTSFDVTIRAVDQFWNRVPGISSRLTLSSTDVFADLPESTTLNNGQALIPVTLYREGYQTITVTDADSSNIASHTSDEVRILAGTFARVLVLAPGEVIAPGTEEGRAGTPTDQSITYAFDLTVYATDEWWNPKSGVSDVVSITCSDPMAELPEDTPLVDGMATMTMRLSTGGYQQITVENVTQPSMPVSTTQVRAISSGLHLEVEVAPTNVQAGEEFVLYVRMTNDAGSIIQEVNSMVTIEAMNAVTQDPGQGTLLSTQFQLLQGQRTLVQSYTYAEPIILILQDDENNEPGVTEVITVAPGEPAVITLSSDPTWVRGNRHATLSALVADEFGNGVPEQPVSFDLVSGTGTLTPADSLTSSEGVVQADFLSPRVPEIDRIRASSNGLIDELDIETALVDPETPSGTVTNYPNPFHPDEAPTTIAYKIAADASVTLRIFTLNGGLVLKRDFASGGTGGVSGLNEFKWDGRNGKGERVSSGGYILVIEARREGETLHTMRHKVAVVR